MDIQFDGSELLNQAENLEIAAKELSDAASRIRKAVELLGGSGNGTPKIAVGQPPPRLKKDGALTRFGQLDKFLRENGPCDRQTILEQAEVPAGSIRAILNFRNFDQDELGLWSAKDWQE